MNNGAHTVVEDSVVVVLAVLREAVRAAFLSAVEIFRAEIPAAWPLHEVAANRRHVANLRRRDSGSSLRNGNVLLLDRRMLLDLRERDQRADTQSLFVFADLVESAD